MEEKVEIREEVEETKTDIEEVIENIEDDGAKLRKDLEDEVENLREKLFNQEVASTLKEHDLEMFADVVNVTDRDDLNGVIQKLSQIVSDIKLSTGYVPTDNLKQDAYTQAKQNGDSKNMIKALFGKR